MCRDNRRSVNCRIKLVSVEREIPVRVKFVTVAVVNTTLWSCRARSVMRRMTRGQCLCCRRLCCCSFLLFFVFAFVVVFIFFFFTFIFFVFLCLTFPFVFRYFYIYFF